MKKIFSLLAAVLLAGSMSATLYNAVKVTSVQDGHLYIIERDGKALIDSVKNQIIYASDNYTKVALQGNERYVWLFEGNATEGFKITNNYRFTADPTIAHNQLRNKSGISAVSLVNYGDGDSWWVTFTDDVALISLAVTDGRFIGEQSPGVGGYKAYAMSNLDFCGHDFVFYELQAMTTPYIFAKQTEIDFGTVKKGATINPKTVEIIFGNLTDAVSYSLNTATPFAASGTISASGDKITIAATAVEGGDYGAKLTIFSAADNISDVVTLKMKVFAQYTITTAVNDIEFGTVTGGGVFEYQTERTLTATANYGYHFTQWSDDVTDNPRTIILTQDTTFTAEFAPNQYSINVSCDEEYGHIEGANGVYDYGTGHTYEAIAKYGYHFVRWSDGNMQNPRTIELTQDTTLTAVFAKNTYTISDDSNLTQGHISGAGTYEYMDEVLLTPVCESGYHFVKWSDDNTDTPRTIYIDQNMTLRAIFARNPIIDYEYNSSTGYVVGPTTTPTGIGADSITFTAYPQENYHFVRWADNNTDNPRTIYLDQDMTMRAIFARNPIIDYEYNASFGRVDGPTTTPTGVAADYITFEAIPQEYCYFVSWSDGNTDNPRTIYLSEDMTIGATFDYLRSGNCGDNMALTWTYDNKAKILTISGNGTLNSNYTYGLEAPTSVEELIIAEGVTSIGNSAFANFATLKHLSLASSVKTIQEQAFYNCVNIETIYNYRPTPSNAYSTAFDGVDKFACKLYVLANSVDFYKAAAVWRDFYYTYAIGAEEKSVATDEVTVEPADNTATVTWPTKDNASTYTIQITKDGVVFCTLVFNANGQLTGIAFAPSRNGQAHAPQALMTANGLQFTVTGLNSGTQYGYSVTAKDANDQPVATYSGEFTTTSEGIATGVEEVSSSLQGGDRGWLILHNGQIFILRDGKVYDLTGRKL
jgi:hypothetical protein